MTILRLSDWELAPNAIPDYKTNNPTFLRLAQLYHHMGVKNHLWPLALYQPELSGIDPHAPNLPQDIRLKIRNEVRNNFWYYLREVVRLPSVAGGEPIQYIAHRGNMAMNWSFMNHVMFVYITVRQTGKSRSADCISSWLLDFGMTDTRMMLMTKDAKLRKENIDFLKKIRALLPDWLVVVSKDDADNQIEMESKYMRNRYLTAVAQANEIDAEKVGRGFTSPIFHFDEPAFTKHIAKSLPAALAAGGAAREQAAKNGSPYGCILTTTAGRKDDRDGRYVYGLLQGGATWTEQFLDAPDEKTLITMVERNMSGDTPLINGTFNHRQVGHTDEWLYARIRAAMAKGEDANRDFMNMWTSGSESSPLDPKLNERIMLSVRDAVYTEVTKDLYMIHWQLSESELQERLKSSHFIAGLDTSDAVGRDSIALVIIDAADLSVVGRATVRETNLYRFALFMGDLLIRYPNITLIVERKSTGMAIMDGIATKLCSAGISPFNRMYNVIFDNPEEKQVAYRTATDPYQAKSSTTYETLKSNFGFATNHERRALLYGTVLQEAAKRSGHLIRDTQIASEITSLVVRDGRIDHKLSGNDDHVIALLMCHWFLIHGRNLRNYGINPTAVMSQVRTPDDADNQAEQSKREQFRRIMDELESIANKLKTGTNVMLQNQLEQRFMTLSEQASAMDDKAADSITAIVTAMEEQREQQYMKHQRYNQRSVYKPTVIHY